MLPSLLSLTKTASGHTTQETVAWLDRETLGRIQLEMSGFLIAFSTILKTSDHKKFGLQSAGHQLGIVLRIGAHSAAQLFEAELNYTNSSTKRQAE